MKSENEIINQTLIVHLRNVSRFVIITIKDIKIENN